MNKKFNVLFIGTTDFSVGILDEINKLCGLEKSPFVLKGVVTVPDKKMGRGKKIKASPVKKYIESNNCSTSILQPDKLDDQYFIQQIKDMNLDAIVVVAFRKLPKVLWSIPKKGTFNLHASYLPQYRGAAPINWVIINGENETGITTFFIDDKIDTGNILLQEKQVIEVNETAKTLHDKLLKKGKKLVIKTLEGIYFDTLKSKKQVITDILKKAPKISKNFCQINFLDSVERIYQKIQGLTSYPGAWSNLFLGDKKYIVKFLEVNFFLNINLEAVNTKKEGSLIVYDKKLSVVCKGGVIILEKLKLEGKKELEGKDFINGFKTFIDDNKAVFKYIN